MSNFSDFSAWSTYLVLGILFAALLIANILKKTIPFFGKSLIPTSVIGGALIMIVALIFKLQGLALGAVEDCVQSFLGKVLYRLAELEMKTLGKSFKVHAGNAVALDIVPAGGHDATLVDAQVKPLAYGVSLVSKREVGAYYLFL